MRILLNLSTYYRTPLVCSSKIKPTIKATISIQGLVWLFVSEVDTTMITGELSCFISFELAPLSCPEREGSEKFKMKIYIFSGNRIHARHSATGKSEILTAWPRWLDINWSIFSISVSWFINTNRHVAIYMYEIGYAVFFYFSTYTIRPGLLLVWMFYRYSEGQATFQ